MNNQLKALCKELQSSYHFIPTDRKAQLAQLSKKIVALKASNQQAPLIVICTHNSRRSHIGMCWLAAAATYFGVEGISAWLDDW